MRTKYAGVPAAPRDAQRPEPRDPLDVSELAVGHSYQSAAATARREPETIPGGLLGADYEIANGRYRFKKVYGGLNWTPDLRSPLTEPGVDVTAGEYLLAVEGRDLRPPDNLYARFENTRRRASSRSRSGPNRRRHAVARRSRSCPVESEAALRNRDWVEGNLQARHRGDARHGRLRLRAQHGRRRPHLLQALLLPAVRPRRRSSSTSATTAAAPWPTTTSTSCAGPSSATGRCATAPTSRRRSRRIHGPKVMLIDETAGSGGDLLPWMFRKFELGTLVGKRTWGGLVGILGFPVLLDGGTSPRRTSPSGPRRASASRTRASPPTSRSSRRRPT